MVNTVLLPALGFTFIGISYPLRRESPKEPSVELISQVVPKTRIYGAVSMQTYIYFQTVEKKKDGWGLKSLICMLFIIVDVLMKS